MLTPEHTKSWIGPTIRETTLVFPYGIYVHAQAPAATLILPGPDEPPIHYHEF